MTNDTRPMCPGWGPSPRSRCGHIVHLGYCRCPNCDHVYSLSLIDAALRHPYYANFRHLYPDHPAVAGAKEARP